MILLILMMWVSIIMRETTVMADANMSKPIALDLGTRTVKLNDGNTMPIIGLGTYSLTGNECTSSVLTALKNGYRLIDTAYIYHNEESIGEAIKNSGIPREEIFITTKLYPTQYANAAKAIDDALARLGVNYIDLMLLHHPGAYDVDAYKAMENAVKAGKIRSIGLSCYYTKELTALLPQITIVPAIIQNEIHPYYQDSEVIEYIQNKGIVVEGWYPLGGRGYTKELLSNKVLLAIGAKYNKTAAQVILRWNLQRNIVVIPGSSDPTHIQENMDIFNFALTAEDMEKISQLNRDEKHDWY